MRASDISDGSSVETQTYRMHAHRPMASTEQFALLAVRHLAGDGAHGLAIVVVDEARRLEETERHAQADLARLHEADGDVRRRHQADLEVARPGLAAEDVGAVDRRQVRIAFEADADAEHRGIRS